MRAILSHATTDTVHYFGLLYKSRLLAGEILPKCSLPDRRTNSVINQSVCIKITPARQPTLQVGGPIVCT